MSMLNIFFNVIASIGAILLCINYIPDVLKSIQTEKMKGVTVSSQVILLIGFIFAIITNIHFKIYPFVVNNIISSILVTIILINRIKKGEK